MAIAILRYTFQFDPSETWSNLSQFEKYIHTSLEAIGLQSEFSAPLGAPASERYIIITKKPEPIAPPAQPPKPVKRTLSKLKDPKTYE